MSVKLETVYRVSDGIVKLTVSVGNGQMGSSIVSLDDEFLQMGEIIKLKIGKGADIAGKTLSVKTVVTDVNDKTNHTSVGYVFEGGVSKQEYNLDAIVSEEGDSIIYRAKFQFEN